MKPLRWLAAAGVCASAAFDIGGALLLRRWTSSCVGRPDGREPVTILRPIKRGIRDLAGILRDTLQVMDRGDQLLVGVSEESSELAIARGISDPRLQVVICPADPGGNPKVAKLIRLARLAEHQIWCMVDAEARIPRELLEICRAECDQRTLVTASYYYRGEDATVWDRVDQAGFHGFFWPGVAWARCGEAAFAFGACMAIRRELLERLGGWANFEDRLAEDYWLGKDTAQNGGRVLQVPIPIELEPDRMSFSALWKTARRRMVTYRTCRPESFAGTIATQGPMWASLLLALSPRMPWRWMVFFASLAVRSGAIAANRRYISEGRCILRPIEIPAGAWAASLVETAAWAMAWIAPGVEWSGRKLRIGGDGRIR